MKIRIWKNCTSVMNQLLTNIDVAVGLYCMHYGFHFLFTHPLCICLSVLDGGNVIREKY